MRKLMLTAVIAAAAGYPGAARSADYAPLDCAEAQSAAEITICRSYSLGQAEARMATLYAIDMSLVAMGQRGDIGDAQRQWLKTREACGRDVACLSKAYGDRIRQLNSVIGDIASRGPY
ncbi:MAG TPA: lysozyme inhibitor LprI family protein [Xanthobacteraceae bacterium]|nr:lysozyme inhibitor LprI family protein [Xanthobacteraceae bacterium]